MAAEVEVEERQAEFQQRKFEAKARRYETGLLSWLLYSTRPLVSRDEKRMELDQWLRGLGLEDADLGKAMTVEDVQAMKERALATAARVKALDQAQQQRANDGARGD